MADLLLDRLGISYDKPFAVKKLAKVIIDCPDTAREALTNPNFINDSSIEGFTNKFGSRYTSLSNLASQNPRAKTDASEHRWPKRISAAIVQQAAKEFDEEKHKEAFKAILETSPAPSALELVSNVIYPLIGVYIEQCFQVKPQNPIRLVQDASEFAAIIRPFPSIKQMDRVNVISSRLLNNLEESIDREWLHECQSNSGLRQVVLEETTQLGHEERKTAIQSSLLGLIIGTMGFAHTLTILCATLLRNDRVNGEQMRSKEWRSTHLSSLITQHSPIRYILRRSVSDDTIQGEQITAGQYLCIDVASIPAGKQGSSDVTFGAGRHSCPGRKLTLISLDCYLATLIEYLSEYELEKDEWEFGFLTRYPSEIWIKKRGN